VEVADRFYVKPLLRAIAFPQAAFVLALAAGSVRLVEITRDGPALTVDVPGLPSDAASAAGKASLADRSPDRRIQGSEGQKVRLRQYARKVDQALRGVLTGLEPPLILAATGPLDNIYRSLSSYPHRGSRARGSRRSDSSRWWGPRTSARDVVAAARLSACATCGRAPTCGHGPLLAI
jgi:hypothetical protein